MKTITCDICDKEIWGHSYGDPLERRFKISELCKECHDKRDKELQKILKKERIEEKEKLQRHTMNCTKALIHFKELSKNECKSQCEKCKLIEDSIEYYKDKIWRDKPFIEI